MLRSLSFLIVFLAGLVLGPLYYVYGEIDPCRALAVEKARRALASDPMGGLFTGSDAEFRRETATMTYAQCAGGLVESWFSRITG